jgi:hypothetical protein
MPEWHTNYEIRLRKTQNGVSVTMHRSLWFSRTFRENSSKAQPVRRKHNQDVDRSVQDQSKNDKITTSNFVDDLSTKLRINRLYQQQMDVNGQLVTQTFSQTGAG